MTSAPCCVFTSVVTVVGKSFTSPVMTTRSFRHLSCGRLSSSSPLRIDLPKPPLLCCRHIILSHRGRSQILPSCSRLRPLLLSKCCYKCLSLGSTFTRSLIYTKLLRRRRSFRNLIEGGGGGLEERGRATELATSSSHRTPSVVRRIGPMMEAPLYVAWSEHRWLGCLRTGSVSLEMDESSFVSLSRQLAHSL